MAPAQSDVGLLFEHVGYDSDYVLHIMVFELSHLPELEAAKNLNHLVGAELLIPLNLEEVLILPQRNLGQVIRYGYFKLHE